MSLLEKLKKEAKATMERREHSDYEKIDWFKPQVGDNRIRFLPNLKKPNDLPWVIAKVHFITKYKADGAPIKGIPVRCMNDYKSGKECPVCDAFEKTIKVDKERAREYRASERFIYNIVCYETRKVQPYAAGFTIHEELMGWINEFDTNLFDLEEGYDWKLTKTQKAGQSKLNGTRYKLRPASSTSALPEKLHALLDGASDLSTLYAPNPDDYKAMCEFVGGLDDSDEDDDGYERLEDHRAKAKLAAAKAKGDDDEDDEEDEKPRAKFKRKDEDDEEDEKPRAKFKRKDDEEERPRFKKSTKSKDDDEEDYSDKDLDRELRELGV